MRIDPVCGMDINEEEAAAKAKYEGKTYYFCSTDCKREFLDTPELYAFEDEDEEDF